MKLYLKRLGRLLIIFILKIYPNLQQHSLYLVIYLRFILTKMLILNSQLKIPLIKRQNKYKKEMNKISQRLIK